MWKEDLRPIGSINDVRLFIRLLLRSDLSCLFLQCRKLLYSTLNVCLGEETKLARWAYGSNHNDVIPVQAAQLLEAVCRPLSRDPYQVYESVRPTTLWAMRYRWSVRGIKSNKALQKRL